MNNIYLFLLYILCTSVIIYLIHTVILTELNKYHIKQDNDDYDDDPQMLSYQLRGLYIDSLVEDKISYIQEHVNKSALNGKRSLNFTIMCLQLKNKKSNDKCNNYDGYNEWVSKKQNNNGIIVSKNINPKIIRNRVIHRLQHIFPDSNITKNKHKCCDYYKISWTK
jgi:RNase P protein component